MVGDNKAIDEAIEDIKQLGFSLKIQGDLKDYLSCEIHTNQDLTKAWLGQPYLIKKLEKKFGNQVKNLKRYKMPGTPNFNVTRKFEESERIDKEHQKLYRSGVGMLLFLVKHSRPDIASSTKKLATSMQGSNKKL